MAKAKKPAKPKKWTKIQTLESKLINVDNVQNGALRVLGRLENQVKALEAAICPRVAARLHALEKDAVRWAKVATIQDDQLKAYAARVNALEDTAVGKPSPNRDSTGWKTLYDELHSAAKRVVDRWEQGDLAGAIRDLDSLL